MSEVRADILAKILLVQNIVGQLPEESSIFGFLCRALKDMPGVLEASVDLEGQGSPKTPAVGSTSERISLAIGDKRYGVITLNLGEAKDYAPYAPFVRNLCFMVSVILEEKRQRTLNAALQRELEARVQERTAQLSEEKERLAVTLRSIGDGVITTDVHGAVCLMNKVAEHLTGWTTAEAAGRPLAEVFRIINEQSRRSCENPCDKVLNTGLIVELANHTVLIARDGTERPIADSAAPIRDSQSIIVGVVLVFRDMTEKHKLLANAQRNDRLDALGLLAGGIAHDFNNLLGGLFGYLDQAQRMSSESLVILNLEKALGVFNRARDLTQQLLTFSKGGVPVKHTADIRPLLRESSAFALSGSNVACAFDIADDLWTCDFDNNQIGQVIDNMVINAHQAMPNGGMISIAACNTVLEEHQHGLLAAGEYLRISISDTGIGIPHDKLHRIFDPFYTTKQTGNGLGLATCHSIIQKHDGAIEVESVVGKGTRFDLFLPASRVTPQKEEALRTRGHRGSGTILLMDDEAYMRDVISMSFKAMGYETIATKDGAEAVEAWKLAQKEERPLKAIFLDLTVKGGMGGKEASEVLRRLGAAIPIMATSGYSGDPIISKPLDHGFTASLQKPFTLEDLSDLLNLHLS